MAALYKEQLGELIAERRHALGLTQTELAEKAHVKESTTVSRWERGERGPNDLEAVARALETTAAEMLSQLAPVSQAGRKRLQPGGLSQLDRIEAKLDDLLSRVPAPDLAEDLEQELDDALQPAAKPSTGTGASGHTPGRRRKAS